MQSYDQFYAQLLKARIEAERQHRLEALGNRVPPDEYLVKVGFLAALRWVEDACVDVERELKSK